MTTVSVLTCARPHGASYVMDTLRGIDDDLGDDAGGRVLVCDGVAPDGVPDGWEVVVVERGYRPQADNKHAAWVAIRMALATGGGLLFLEDDVRPLRHGVFREMLRREVPSWAAFVSFFHPTKPAGRYPVRDFMMSQAVLFPARSLRWLSDAATHYAGDWEAVVGVDLAISVLGRIDRLDYEQTENAVAHVGVVSAQNDGKPVGWWTP